MQDQTNCGKKYLEIKKNQTQNHINRLYLYEDQYLKYKQILILFII